MKRLPSAILGSLCLALWGAGCADIPATQKIADTLAPTDSGRAVVAQDAGFGQLPKIAFAGSVSGTSTGIVRINATLPTLQPTVTVVRVPAGTADRTQFGNMTTAMGLPAGAIGEEAKNLTLEFTWTNAEGYVWSYRAENSRLAFSNPTLQPSSNTTNAWPSEEQALGAAHDFVVGHGFKESDYRHFALVSATGSLPSVVPVTVERVVDERNIVGKDGRPEIGGQLYVNAQTKKVVSGWLALPNDPQRSDYPAISADDMRKRLEQGGVAGKPAGKVDIDSAFFAFVRLPRQNDYDAEYLVPALVGEGTEQLVQGGSRPYRIVVPLIKQ